MTRRIITRTSGLTRMRYARRRMKRRSQESKNQDGLPTRVVLGQNGTGTIMAEKNAGHEYVLVSEIALVRKENTRRHHRGDVQ